MKIIHKFINSDNPLPDNQLLFDIETTGFHRRKSLLYLIGCCFRKDDSCEFIQWFNDDGKSEDSMLYAFSSLMLSQPWSLLTFNGESFDIPYLKERFLMHGVMSGFSHCSSDDLYRQLRPFQQLYHMDHGSQKSWEEFLGIFRRDPYNGGDLIDVYRRYLISGDEKDEEALLLHNEEDIMGMLKLLPLLSYRSMTDFDQLVIESVDTTDSVFPDSDGSLLFRIRSSAALPKPLEVDSQIGSFSARDDQIEIRLPCLNTSLRYYYPDYRNYYYLPREDKAVHKSVGCYVDRRFRMQAKASTCYTKKEGIFLILPTQKKHYGITIADPGRISDYLPDFRRYYRDVNRYIRMEDLMKSDPFTISSYLHNIIKEIFITSLREYENPEK